MNGGSFKARCDLAEMLNTLDERDALKVAAEWQPLTKKQIEAGWEATFSTNNPYCPCNLKSFTKAVEWAERQRAAMTKELNAQKTPFAWWFNSDVGVLLSTDFSWVEKTHAVAGIGPINPLYTAH